MSALSEDGKKHLEKIKAALNLPSDDQCVTWDLIPAHPPSRVQGFLEEVRQLKAAGQPFKLENLERLNLNVEEVIELIDGIKALGAKVNVDYRVVPGGWELFNNED